MLRRHATPCHFFNLLTSGSRNLNIEHIQKLILWLAKVTRRSIAMTFAAPSMEFWDMH
jgi:hypothetical protein